MIATEYSDRLKEAGLPTDQIRLSKGKHSEPAEGVCAMELASVLAGETFSDHPDCVSTVLIAFVRDMNDFFGEEDRALLIPYLPRLLYTRGIYGNYADNVNRLQVITRWLFGHKSLLSALITDAASAAPEHELALRKAADLCRSKPIRRMAERGTYTNIGMGVGYGSGMASAGGMITVLTASYACDTEIEAAQACSDAVADISLALEGETSLEDGADIAHGALLIIGLKAIVASGVLGDAMRAREAVVEEAIAPWRRRIIEGLFVALELMLRVETQERLAVAP